MPLLPPGSCDTHLHLFGAIARYPMRHPKPLYQISPDWTLEALRKMHASLGITRYVAVQPTAYINDHSCMIDMLAAEMPDTARGVAIIDDTIDDKIIARMHEVGVRGARFNFQSRFGLVPSFEEFHRSVARIRPYGWIIKIFVMDELPEVENAVNTTAWLEDFIVSTQDKHINAKGRYVGTGFFDVFSYELIEGNKDEVLSEKNAILISESFRVCIHQRECQEIALHLFVRRMQSVR